MSKQRVFVSYSHEPPENSAFARQLAERLRSVGFEAWLDEEMIPASADVEHHIREAIDGSAHGLFIVTQRWLDRDWTRTELKLFSNRPPEIYRRVAVRREEIPSLELQPHLQHLHVVKWLPGDADPDARFWEVYCGLTNTAPGPRHLWGQRARELSSHSVPPLPLTIPPVPKEVETAKADKVPEPGQPWLPCGSRPALALATHDAVFLLTESGECCRASLDDVPQVEPLPTLTSWSSAVIEPGDLLIVGLYSAMTASLKEGDWIYRATDSPVLSMATSRDGVVIGDSSGSIVFRDRRGGVIATTTLGEPVVELRGFDQEIAALGGRGAVAKLGWPEEGAVANEPIAPSKNLGKVVGLFASGQPERFGIYSADRLALVDATNGKVTVGDRTFPEGIHSVLPMGRGGKRLTYGVVNDAGALWVVEADLKEARVVLFPGDPPEVTGICPAGAGGLLAWTACGSLYSVTKDRAVRKVAITDVVLAYSGASTADQLWAVRWKSEKGMQVVKVRSDQER
jgi:hypothetical protein